MSDIARQQKVASAKKKLKKFQKGRSPVNGQTSQNEELGKEILRGIQNNHIFKTPPLIISNNQTNHDTPKSNRPNQLQVNQKLIFSNNDTPPLRNVSPVPNYDNNTPVSNSNGTVPGTQMLNGSIPHDNKTEELNQQITSYKRSNEQLGNQVNDQRKQIIQLQERLKKEDGSSQKLVEQRALKEQLEVHIQTIGILVSEKSELQTNVASIQKKLSSKENEILEINNQLKTLRQYVLDLEKNISQYKTTEGQWIQANKEVALERDKASTKLYEVNHEKEDLQLQNSELHSKLQMKVEECTILLSQVNELHTKLQKGDLMVQQLSANGVDPVAVTKWHAEKEELTRLLNEQKNIVQRLVSDKAELLEKQNDVQSHYDVQIEQLKNKINSLEGENLSLVEKANALTENLEIIQRQLDLKADYVPPQAEVPTEQNTVQNEEHENVKKEKLSLEKELDIQINENRRLGRVVFEQNVKIEELETSIGRLNAEKTDKLSLLDQIQADKETISRALQQNKSLKEQLEELEQGFVKMSNSSADLTDKLDAEQRGNKDVATKLSDVQVELEETKIKLNDKSKTCENLDEELQRFKTEVRHVQMKLAEKEMDIDLLSTELETVKNDLSHASSGESSRQSNPVPDNIMQELHSAHNTINDLSHENSKLKETIETLQTSLQTSTANLDGSLYPGRQIDSKHFSQSPPPNYNVEEGEEEVEEEEESLTDEELHARSWEELDDDSDEMSESVALRITEAEVNEMQYSLKQLQEERSKILFLLQEEREKVVVATDRMEEHLELQVQQQLKQRERELQEHFYEQTEALQHKVQSLQEALEVMRKNEDIADFDMTSDGITMPLLKTAFMQLQKRYKDAMDGKAQLSDRIDQLEHVNMQLENETETIGEYIALYQTQRQALKAKFSEKDQIITQLSNEHGRMQTKVTQLHQLVMQTLSERSGFESKNKQLQELVNRRLAFQIGESSEEEVPKLQYNLDNLFGQMTLTPDEENELVKDNITVAEDIRNDTSNDQTTQQILQIFEQLETTGEGYQHGWLSPAARKHDFKPCKNCSSTALYL